MENRSYARIAFKMGVEIISGSQHSFVVESRDISQGGLQVESSTQLPKGTECDLVLRPAPNLGIEAFALKARVVRHPETGMGMAFVQATSGNLSKLVGLLGLIMTRAYTPGLRVTRHTSLQRRRQLPLKGNVLVKQGDAVLRDQVVAHTNLPGHVTTLNLVNTLSCSPSELPSYMLKKEGDAVVKGEPIAETKPLVKWFKTSVPSPITGTLESISKVTGQVILREPPRPVEVQAYIDGQVIEVIPQEGVVIETTGAFVQGIFGVGGETCGTLCMLAKSASDVLLPHQIDDSCKNKIIVGGSLITFDVIQKARDVGASGIIGGGIRDADLRTLLGYDLGVAITGTENIGITVIVTEGFGTIDMALKTFGILSENSGKDASISGATQIRAGVQRPEIIIPNSETDTQKIEKNAHLGLSEGALLRVIRVPYFGRVGKVVSLPAELQTIESETRVRVLEVVFEDGTRAIVPRANVELIEE